MNNLNRLIAIEFHKIKQDFRINLRNCIVPVVPFPNLHKGFNLIIKAL